MKKKDMKHICKPLKNNKTLDPTDFHCTTKTKQKQNFFKTIFFCFPHEKEGFETCQ